MVRGLQICRFYGTQNAYRWKGIDFKSRAVVPETIFGKCLWGLFPTSCGVAWIMRYILDRHQWFLIQSLCVAILARSLNFICLVLSLYFSLILKCFGLRVSVINIVDVWIECQQFYKFKTKKFRVFVGWDQWIIYYNIGGV